MTNIRLVAGKDRLPIAPEVLQLATALPANLTTAVVESLALFGVKSAPENVTFWLREASIVLVGVGSAVIAILATQDGEAASPSSPETSSATEVFKS